jgi:hypothetical protein
MADAVAIPGSRTEARIAWLTLVIGFGAAFIAHFLRHRDWAVGLFFGSGLGWINFSGLRRGLDVLVLASRAQHGQEKPQVPWWNSILAVFRYALIGLAVYVIFIYLHVPLLSLIAGLCALAAATIVASVWEILAPEQGHLDR